MWRQTVTHVRVGVIDQGIEHFDGLPDAHTSSFSAFEVDSGFDVICHCLFFYG